MIPPTGAPVFLGAIPSQELTRYASCRVFLGLGGVIMMTGWLSGATQWSRVSLSSRRRAEHFMGMPDVLERWTAAQVRELPDDGKRYEVVDGELLVTPAPRFDHQEAVARLWQILDRYLAGSGVGHAVVSPADVELDPHTLVQPDVFVVALVDGRRPKNWSDIRGLLLAVEVLSPSSARADRSVKRRRFQRAGIPEYWVVDVDARLVERWRPGDERPEILTDDLTWQPDVTREPLIVDLRAYFTQVLGES